MAIVPNALPSQWFKVPLMMDPPPRGRRLAAGFDDLNRLTLAATCSVLPLCRDREVALLVRLVPESIRIKVDSQLLELAAICLLEEASALAGSNVEGGWLVVETCRESGRAELRMIACGHRRPAADNGAVRAARQVVEAHGGSLDITIEGDQTTFATSLPLSEPEKGGIEARVDLSAARVAPPLPMKPEPWRATTCRST